MKKALVGLSAVALAAAALMARPASAPPRAPVPAAPAVAADPAAAPSLPPSPAGARAHRLGPLLPRLDRLNAARRKGSLTAPEEDERLVSEGDAARLDEEIRALLRTDPAAWPDLMDLLCSMNDAATALRLSERFGSSLDDPAERRAVEIARTGSSGPSRQAALTLLGARKSPSSRTALAAAARDDPEAPVRRIALLAIIKSEDPDTEAIVRRSSQSDRDPELRAMALRYLGEPVPGEVKPPAPTPRKSPLHPQPAVKKPAPSK